MKNKIIKILRTGRGVCLCMLNLVGCFREEEWTSFGGGDIKLLSALGAWLGVLNVVYVILVACVLFVIKAIILKKREGAFGPELAISAIGVAFVCF